MALDADQAADIAGKLLKLREAEQPRLQRIAAYVAGRAESVYVPKGAREEYRWLIQRAKVNMLPLVVTTVAQNLFVDGYRPERSEKNAAAWKVWQANRMDARQHGLHRAALKYGVAYSVVLPGRVADQEMPVIKPTSPRRLTAFYADPVDDEWPQFAVEETVQNTVDKPRRLVRLYDDTARYQLEGEARPGSVLRFARMEEHNLGVCPVVRFLSGNDLDGDDSVRGEVEPLIEMQDQVNATTLSRMMAEQYAAFRQRYVSGMVAVDESGRPKAPFQAAVDRLWVAEDPDTRFGEFSATDVTPYLSSVESTVRHMATVSQTPPHHLLGTVANLSAEALNSARDGLNSKTAEYQSSFGEGHEQELRLAALASGDDAGWRDTAAQVVWRDTAARSLSQTVDALGKLVQMLGVPPQVLWERIPGVTQQDVARWEAAAKEADSISQLNEILDKGLGHEPAPNGQPPNAGATMGGM